MFTRNQARMIAEELYKMLRSDVRDVTEAIAEDENEEFITLKEAAAMLSISPSNLYKTKDQYGCYTKINGRIKFAKSRLKKTILNGQIRDRVAVS